MDIFTIALAAVTLFSIMATVLAMLASDNARKQRLIERLTEQLCRLPPDNVPKTHIISPYKPKSDGGGDDWES